MRPLRLLSDQELIDASHELRHAALRGSTEGLAEARRHEMELRRRFIEVEQDGWSTSNTMVPASTYTEQAVDEPVTLTAAVQHFLLSTADMTTLSVEAVGDLLHHLRVILEMDIAYMAEFVGGNQVYRVIDGMQDADVQIDAGASAPLETTLCQHVVDGRLPSVSRDARLEPEIAEFVATKVLRIGAYLSVPVMLHDGRVYGTLCCISHVPRPTLGSRQLDSLRYVAGVLAVELDKRQESLG